MRWETFKERALDWLLPRDAVCCLCGEEARLDAQWVCASCRKELRPCGPLPPLWPLKDRRAGFVYTKMLQTAVHAFKYDGLTYLKDFFAANMEIPAAWRPDVLVPVPLYPQKQAERGYNQSELLAGPLSVRYGIPVETGVLRRIRDTGTQTAMTAAQRRLNMEGAFAASRSCAGKRIVLLDDVQTTGSTLRACAAALYAADAAAVFALTAAAVPPKDRE